MSRILDSKRFQKTHSSGSAAVKLRYLLAACAIEAGICLGATYLHLSGVLPLPFTSIEVRASTLPVHTPTEEAVEIEDHGQERPEPLKIAELTDPVLHDPDLP